MVPAVGGRVPFLATRVRDPWPCGFAHNAHTAVSRCSSCTIPFLVAQTGSVESFTSGLAHSNSRLSSFAGVALVTDRDIWEASPMNQPRDSALPIDGAHCREMAHGLRKLARQCRLAGARRELLQLAASYERR